METTFITFHNLTPDATILFASDSIFDVLGYQPDDVRGRSCFEYFHPDEVPLAQHIHNRSVQLDKAAVLHYARIRANDGQWVGCECIFTVVYDVLVGCTSIYRGDAKNNRRAAEAPAIRRLFASSPRDPRYHMLEHLSSKFRTPTPPTPLEPRAAIMLNRFTRTLTVMYATDAVQSILGITAEQFRDKSFYECMQEDCLPEAIRCLESGKANDSIAYLRFKYRDPRRPEDMDQQMAEAESSQSSDSDDGGVSLERPDDGRGKHSGQSSASPTGGVSLQPPQMGPRTLSGYSTDLEQDAPNAVFDAARVAESSSSSLNTSSPEHRRAEPRQARASVPIPEVEEELVELEAVVSCTSDGLVVVLRRARPLPPAAPQKPAVAPVYPQGLFVAPWGAYPIRPHVYQPDPHNPFQHGFGAPPMPINGPSQDMFLQSIREVAAFAWSLTGINGKIAAYSRGNPHGEAQPPAGLPVWDPYAQPRPEYAGPENQAAERWARMGHGTNEGADGNTVPYQHHHQEARIRQNHGFGNGPIGSDRPGSSGLRHLGGNASMLQGPMHHPCNDYNPHGQVQGQEGWTAAPAPDGSNDVHPQEKGSDGPKSHRRTRF